MPASSFSEYAQYILDIFQNCLASGQATLVDHTIDQRSAVRGFISAVLYFEDGSQLHVREFVDTSQSEPRLMYAYHYQDVDANLVFRYDNAAHKPELSQSEHKHMQDSVQASRAPDLQEVIDEIFG